jgi:hypothetical protein
MKFMILTSVRSATQPLDLHALPKQRTADLEAAANQSLSPGSTSSYEPAKGGNGEWLNGDIRYRDIYILYGDDDNFIPVISSP